VGGDPRCAARGGPPTCAIVRGVTVTWTKLSDDFNERTDLMLVSRSARHLLVELYVFGNRLLLDGRIPRVQLRRLTDSEDAEDDLAELLSAEVVTEDGDVLVIDWKDQRTREEVLAQREYNAEKNRRYRVRRDKHKRGDHCDCDPRYCTAAVTGNATSNETGVVTDTRPVPSRPKDRGQGPAAGGSADATPRPPSEVHAYLDDGSGLSCDECNLPAEHPTHAIAD